MCPEQVYGAMEGEGENTAPQPGHFTKVYLETLRKANQRYVGLAMADVNLLSMNIIQVHLWTIFS